MLPRTEPKPQPLAGRALQPMPLAARTVQPLVSARPPRQPFWRSMRGVLVFSGIAICFQSLTSWQAHHGIFINASESLPNWAFMIETGKFPERGQYVVFKPGSDPLVIEHFGKKPGAFAKIAYGIPGDVVSRDGAAVSINGRQVARIKPLTRQGEVLIPGPTGVVPRGCIFAGTPHKDGFDSRYAEIGFVCRDRLVGVGEPIL